MLENLNKDEFLKTWQAGHPPVADVRDATDEENEKDWLFDLADSFTDHQVETLFPKHALRFCGWHKQDKRSEAYSRVAAVCKKMSIWAVNEYTIIKGRKAYTYKAAENYPIFLIDESEFKMVYQPYHTDSEMIYQYDRQGKDNYMFGKRQIASEMRIREKNLEDQKQEKEEGDSETPIEKKPTGKIKEVFFASEAAQAFGLALLGYFVCWKRSAAGVLETWDFIDLTKQCKKVYQVRNNTDISYKICHQNALASLDLYTLELPHSITKLNKDQSEVIIPIKTLRDFQEHKNDYALTELMNEALPYRFWEQTPEYEGRGDARKRVGFKYEFDHVQAYNFLTKMGFYRLPVEGQKSEYVYVQKEGNIVKERTANNVKNFIHRFVKDRKLDKRLRNTLFESNRLNETSLSNLDETAIDFTDYDTDSQYLFFLNNTWEIKSHSIKSFKPGDIKRFVWERDVIEHNTSILESPFTLVLHPDGKSYDIRVNHHNCLFFNYLIQTSRVHWRKELEVELPKLSDAEQSKYLAENKFNIAGSLLSPEEQMEQKQHLINKVYALGHLMHQKKNRSKDWAVVAYDANISKDGRSHGGSGKSICFNQALPKVLKNVFRIPGTNPDKTKDPHIFHGLDKFKRLTIIDDADKYLNFRFFFEYITGDQVVNPKQNQPFVVEYEHLCKLVWLTNFSFSTDPSTERRILYTVFSDYYHAKTDNNGYKESRGPNDDFGKELFTQFDEREYNLFFNTMARCIQAYIASPFKLTPPMDSILKRNLQRDMGQEFEQWASIFFSPIAGNTDKLLVKDEAWMEFTSQLPKNHRYTTSAFKKAIESYCRFNGYVFNPEELINDKKHDRIIHQVPVRELKRDGGWTDSLTKKAKECIYIQTDFEKPVNYVVPGTTMSF